MRVCVCVCIYIQGVSRLEDIIAGGDFLGLCDQKINRKFVRFWTVTELWSFLNSRTRPRVNRVSRNQLTGDVLDLMAYLLRCQHYFSPPDSRSSQPSGSLCCGRRWHFRKPALSTDQFKLKVIS